MYFSQKRYVVFTFFHYLAGGVNEDDERFVYGVLNWAEPGEDLFELLSYPIRISSMSHIKVTISDIGNIGFLMENIAVVKIL